MSVDKEKKEALKALRAERKEAIAAATGNMKRQRKTLKAIRQFLEKDPATVPQVAEGVDMPTDTVLWFMAAMKKYGEVVEDGKDGSYYRYGLIAKEKPGDTEEADTTPSA
jgi:predicted transcriptional regulator